MEYTIILYMEYLIKKNSIVFSTAYANNQIVAIYIHISKVVFQVPKMSKKYFKYQIQNKKAFKKM